MEPAGGEVSFESIRAVREGLGKTTLDDVLKPAVRSVAFIFDDTRVVDAYAFLSSQRIISVRTALALLFAVAFSPHSSNAPNSPHGCCR